VYTVVLAMMLPVAQERSDYAAIRGLGCGEWRLCGAVRMLPDSQDGFRKYWTTWSYCGGCYVYVSFVGGGGTSESRVGAWTGRESVNPSRSADHVAD
jgi:hypothetical protein